MANRLNSNPIYYDQFDADATLAAKGTPITISKIIVLSAANDDLFQLEDGNGNVIVYGKQGAAGAGYTYEIDFPGKGQRFNNGVIIDESDCTGMDATDGTDAVWLYIR